MGADTDALLKGRLREEETITMTVLDLVLANERRRIKACTTTIMSITNMLILLSPLMLAQMHRMEQVKHAHTSVLLQNTPRLF